MLERFPSVHGTRSRNIVIDWSAVGCAWLRRLGKTWALETLPQYEQLQALTWASRALETSRAFTDPLLAGRAEIAAIIAYCKRQTTSDGTPFKSDYPQRRLWELKAILAFCRGRRTHGRHPGHVRAHHKPPERQTDQPPPRRRRTR